MEKNVYVVFSCTNYRTGKLIRILTGAQYNHVSIALDPEFARMYSFARRHHSTPMLGGFVKESLSRYSAGGKTCWCTVCKIPLTTVQYAALEAQLEEMYANKEKYLYNYLSALATPFRRRIQVRDALLCVEFVADTLGQLDTPVVKGKFYTMKDLHTLLAPWSVYTGCMPEPTECDDDYFATKPVPHPHLASARAMFALLPRLRKEDEKTALK